MSFSKINTCSASSSEDLIFDTFVQVITSNNWKTGVNVVALVSRFKTSSGKCWTANVCIHASKSPLLNKFESTLKINLQSAYLEVVLCFRIIQSHLVIYSNVVMKTWIIPQDDVCVTGRQVNP